VARTTEPQVGERVKGRVVAVGEETVFVDLGSGSEGVLDVGEVRRDDGTIEVAVGDMVETVIAGRDSGSRSFVLRRKGPAARAGVARLRGARARPAGQGVVRSVNKGGIEVEVSGHTAFCRSHDRR
jgi:small subunit ribosomal protein S1